MYFNVSVMKMHVVHEATDDTERRMRLLLILLSHFSYLLKQSLCFVGAQGSMSFTCVFTYCTQYSIDTYCIYVTLSSTILIVV